MISISIVSGHEYDRKTITDLLVVQEDFRIASTGKDGFDALKSAKTEQPDIIIADFRMSDIDSPELAPLVKRHSPSTELIVLCSENEHGTLSNALKAGISGYLLKQEGFDNLALSVRCVYYGGLYVSNQAKNLMMKFINEFNYFSITKEMLLLDGNEKKNVFSKTETEIFNGIAMGYKDGEIAKHLNINQGTVRNNVKRIKQRTGMENRTQITIYALLNGIINLEKIRKQFTGKFGNNG